MPARKAHRKSRTGCVSCKRRHIKCGEERPTCRNCIEYEVLCEYLVPKLTKQASQTTYSPSPSYCSGLIEVSVQARTVVGSPVVRQPGPLSDDINTSDMELLHQFSTSTYRTMSNVPEEQKLWQTAIVAIGLQHTFVLRGILALAALHLCYLKSPSESIDYIVKASTHQGIGLTAFRGYLQHIDASNFDAVLAFSCILLIHSIADAACSTLRGTISGHDILSEFVKSIQMVRSVNSLLLPSLKIYTSTISLLAQVVNQELREAPIYPGIQSLDRLEAACAIFSNTTSSATCHAQRITFRSAIDQLRTAFARTVDAKSSEVFTIGVVLIWSIEVSDEYIMLLTQRHPCAIAIFAHFAALLHRQQSLWWLEGLSPALVEDISAELGDEWVEVMQWPKLITGLPVGSNLSAEGRTSHQNLA